LYAASALLLIGLLTFGDPTGEEQGMIDIQETAERLKCHVEMLTVTIGERSVYRPENLEETQTYRYENFEVGNVITQIDLGEKPSTRYLLGAHYDSVDGTVGADDNAASIAVQLETARYLKKMAGSAKSNVSVKVVSFALEEPPTFTTPYMGSKVYARKARKDGEKLDGMVCLEMVGYYCDQPGCQSYPFPLMFMNYPKAGNFIGIVGNTSSRELTRSMERAFRKNPGLPVITLTVPFNGWILPPIRLSDHSAFWDEGFKAVMVTDSAFYRNPHYHLPSDTMDKLDFRRMAELVKSLLIFFGS
jgi:hypothetical protein